MGKESLSPAMLEKIKKTQLVMQHGRPYLKTPAEQRGGVLAPTIKYPSVEELKNKHFPKEISLDKPVLFMSGVDGLEIQVPTYLHTMNTSEAILDGRGAMQRIGELTYGGYSIIFKDKKYVAKNMLEFEACSKKAGVMNCGPVEDAEF